MTDTKIYFGRPGSLIEIYHPRGGLKAPRTRPRSVFNTAGGGVRVGQMAGGKRRYALNWESLQYADFSTLLAFDQGHEGPGPFALIDPGQRNQLTVNQSAATSELNGTDNFTAAGSGYSLSSESTTYRRGPRSLKLTIAYAAQSGTVTLDSPASDWYGVPVVSRPYVFSFYVQGGGTDPIVTITPTLTWYSTTGATVSTSTGTPTPTASGSWAQMYVAATTPATAAYVQCSIAASGGTISAASVLYLDQFQLEEGSAPTTWRPGTGVVPVQVLGLEDEWTWAGTDFRKGPTLLLQEVGP